MVGLGRFELPTPRLSSVCSDQLSYKPPYQNSPKRAVPMILRDLLSIDAEVTSQRLSIC